MCFSVILNGGNAKQASFNIDIVHMRKKSFWMKEKSYYNNSKKMYVQFISR